jgi:hypothetical protein
VGAEVLPRSLGARELGLPGLPRLIEAVADGAGTLRLFFGQGAAVAAIAPDGAPGCALPTDLRAISGAVMAVLSGAGPLALAGGGRLELRPVHDEQALFAGRDCLLSFRIAEGAAQVADALVWHASHHGASGAVIIDRAEADDFAAPLAEALGTRAPGLRVVVLRSPLPLGQPGGLPEPHPISAPDAPGKDRMARPDPDPWTAPLAEGIVVEAVKWRFLAQARAVLALDACDILAPREGGAPSAFDLAATARRGVVTLTGRRIYPWRIRPGQVAGFGDHICQPFDAARDMARWGVAPQKAGLDATWRVHRVAYAKPDADAGPLRFFRAMAVRVPGATQPLAPKTALIEDAGLLALAQTHFAAKPVRPPVTALRAGPVTGVPSDRVAIVTTMKNEGPFILEWLAYHRAIGVDDFLIYTNDCTDGTDTMLDLLQRKGIVQHRDNPFRASGLKPQHAALQAAEDEEIMRACGWGICMDVDEFINIKLGDGRLPTLFSAMEDALPGANMIALTWRLFGNAEVAEYHDRFITEQFTRCAPELIRKPHQAWGFKTLFRNIAIYRKLGVHRPKGLNPDLWDQVRWLNGSGQPLPRAMFRNGWRSTTETYGYDWVSLNHYAVRSAESFLVKRDRGRVNHVDRDQGLNYWFRMNHNAEEDRSILPRLPGAQAEFARLMADPEIAAAHMASVTAHRAKIAELRATENYARFYGELTGERMRRLCRLQKHFGSAVFSAGPGVIPPDLHERDLPPDFFFTVDAVDEAVH